MSDRELQPSFDEVARIAESLAQLLRITGPETPPGFASDFARGKSWAFMHNTSIFYNLHSLALSLNPNGLGPDHPDRRALGMASWPYNSDLFRALGRLIDEFDVILARWGLMGLYYKL